MRWIVQNILGLSMALMLGVDKVTNVTIVNLDKLKKDQVSGFHPFMRLDYKYHSCIFWDSGLDELYYSDGSILDKRWPLWNQIVRSKKVYSNNRASRRRRLLFKSYAKIEKNAEGQLSIAKDDM